ncbi:MAG: lysylphosphatidylglycerol synthetase family protein [Gammaproteobacteria bacterium]|nr:MAG: lysylphosphatidylglycerol synthetase family protein [Gammaproteobacteria bacterium]
MVRRQLPGVRRGLQAPQGRGRRAAAPHPLQAADALKGKLRALSELTAPPTQARDERPLRRWLGPLAALLVLAGVVLLLHRQLSRLHIRSIFEHLHAIPRRQVLAALAFTAASYWLLSTYEVLALRYLRRKIRYPRIVFTSFIAYSFGHTLGFAAFTGAAIRFRLYATAGLGAIDVATLTGFCSLSFGIGLATVSGLSLLLALSNAASMLRLHHSWSLLVGTALLGAVGAYALWASLARGKLEIRGWALRAPGAAIGLTQILLGVADLSLSSAVLWSLLPAAAHISFVSFLGIYAAAVIAGVVSHVPGGVGVFEAVMLLALPGIPPDALLGSLLAYRGVYYLVPLLFATLLFGAKELAGQRPALARAHELASIYVAPVVPQIAGALTFLAGALLLISGATPGIEERLAFLDQFLPLAVLEVSHLGGSLAGLGLLVLSRALFRRVQAAYHISVWLLIAGMFASLLKGLDFEEAIILALILGVLMLGRRAFYRPTAILSERFTPVWVASILGVIAMAVWIGIVSHRQVGYSDQLWWTFALHGNAPRMLRASLAVIVLGSAYILLNMLRPARPEPAVAGPEELARARALIERSDSTLANAALSGDKRLLFSEAGDAFVMYQIAGSSWIALGDPVGSKEGAGELVWRLREIFSASPRSRSARRRACRSPSSRSRAPRAPSCGRLIAARSAMAPASKWCPRKASRRSCPRSSGSRTRGSRPNRPARSASRSARSRGRTCGSSRSPWCAPAALPRRLPTCGPAARRPSSRWTSCASTRTRRAAAWTSCSSSSCCGGGRQALAPSTSAWRRCRVSTRIRSRPRGTGSATSSSATASTSITSRDCGATRRSSIRPGSRAISWRAGGSRCPGCWWTCRC